MTSHRVKSGVYDIHTKHGAVYWLMQFGSDWHLTHKVPLRQIDVGTFKSKSAALTAVEEIEEGAFV